MRLLLMLVKIMTIHERFNAKTRRNSAFRTAETRVLCNALADKLESTGYDYQVIEHTTGDFIRVYPKLSEISDDTLIPDHLDVYIKPFDEMVIFQFGVAGDRSLSAESTLRSDAIPLVRELFEKLLLKTEANENSRLGDDGDFTYTLDRSHHTGAVKDRASVSKRGLLGALNLTMNEYNQQVSKIAQDVKANEAQLSDSIEYHRLTGKHFQMPGSFAEKIVRSNMSVASR